MSDGWVRVTKQFPCKICGRSDWDTFNPELNLFCCMRVPSTRPAKNGGWLHSTESQPIVYVKPAPQPPSINASKMVLRWASETPETALADLADSLGVTEASLAALNAVYAKEHRAWAFPMFDGYRNCIGIRLRSMDGRKWAVTGSRQGVFIPDITPQPTAFIVEGPTDCAAALSIGLFALGRPSCNCGGLQLRVACRKFGVRQIVMVADDDEPGLNGAKRVAQEIGIRSMTWLPPAKDIREFVKGGGTAGLIYYDLKNSMGVCAEPTSVA